MAERWAETCDAATLEAALQRAIRERIAGDILADAR
jgi:hypothetical protein